MRSFWTFTVEWADCDAAGIVYYPHFLRWFDTGFHRLLRLRGIEQRDLVSRYGILGTGAVSVHATFKSPATYGDELTLESRFAAWGASSFTVGHVIRRGEETVVEGSEKRVWMVRMDSHGKLRGEHVPAEFRSLFEASPV